MAGKAAATYMRPIEEVRENMLTRARTHRNPFYCTLYSEVESALIRLESLDREAWAKAFSVLAEPYEEKAIRAETAGDTRAAMENYLIAYNYHHVAWYPVPNSPGKLRAYGRSIETYLKAARYFDPSFERVEMPFHGRPGEGSVCVGYLRRPKDVERAPVVVIWGGIDAYKEERQVDLYLRAGMATLAMDIPGTGDAPLVGSESAERLWDDVFDWIEKRSDLDGNRIGVVGGSTGGYWAAKVAHTHRHRIRAAINHGGMVHFAFTPEWIAKAQYGEYPFELHEALAMAFGLSTCEEWVEYSPTLSLLRHGILDQPCAPLLLINGIHDTVFPIDDMYLLLERGSPKSARFFATGHMGRTPETEPIMVRWMQRALAKK